MARRKVYTFEGVLDLVGGRKAVAVLMGVTPTAVTHWRRTGRFPARTHERVQAELARKDATAVRSLFDFDPPRTYENDEPKRAAKA